MNNKRRAELGLPLLIRGGRRPLKPLRELTASETAARDRSTPLPDEPEAREAAIDALARESKP